MIVPAVETTEGEDGTWSGVLVLAANGALISSSPAAERLVELLPETPRPPSPHEARAVQAVATRARSGRDRASNTDPR